MKFGPFANKIHLGQLGSLLTTTDGVGTKGVFFQNAPISWYSILGADVVNHAMNDLLCERGFPLWFSNYIGRHEANEDKDRLIYFGMKSVCDAFGIQMVGGETAAIPSVYQKGAYEVIGTLGGVKEHEQQFNIEPNQTIIGYTSNGLHTNGFSVVKEILEARGINPLSEEFVHSPLGKELLLSVHKNYVTRVMPSLPFASGIAHITGGGLVDNLQRILPSGVSTDIWTKKINLPPIYQNLGISKADHDNFRVFNMGVGMVLIVPSAFASTIAEFTMGFFLGRTIEGDREVNLWR